MQRALPESVFHCFQLTTLTVMIPLVDVPYLEIISQNTMTCAKLKQLTKDVTRHDTHEICQGIRVFSSTHLPLSGDVVLAELT